MSNTISCGCGKTIPAHGDTTCHCAGCHRSFAGLAAFDRHRVDSRRTALAWSVVLMVAAFATALAWGAQPLSVALMAAALITPTYLDQEETTHD